MTSTLTAEVTLTDTVTRLLDLDVTIPNPSAPADAFTDMAGFAVRDNPRRAHLIVSKVLGKHIPVNPRVILAHGYRLADAVTGVLGGPVDQTALVVGYCETATGLGHAVAEHLNATYLHTTRKQHPDLPVEARFDEEHSHAVAHLIQPAPGISLAGAGPLILVDDELTTGKTALNTIEAIHAQFGRPCYVIATLLDARTPAARAAFEARVADMGVTVKVASVLSAYLTLPDDVLDRAVGARALLSAPAPRPTGTGAEAVWVHGNMWPADVPVTARHGMTPADTARLHDAARRVALKVLPSLAASTRGGSVLVVGTEELLHAPTHLAAVLAEHLPEVEVVNQSTTRSPVHAADDPGYAVRRTETFTCPDDPARESRIHNLYHPEAAPRRGSVWSDRQHTDIVVMVDAPADACTDMLAVLRRYATATIHLITVPATPAL